MEYNRKDTNWIFFIEHLLRTCWHQVWQQLWQPRLVWPTKGEQSYIYISYIIYIIYIYIAFCFIYIWPTKGEQSYHLFFVGNDDNDIEDNDGDGDGDDDGNDDNDIEDDDADDNAAETGSEEQQQGRRGSYGWWPEQGFCYFFY